MAKQQTVWVTDRGGPATSELDAKLGDAGDALEEAVEGLPDLHPLDVDIADYLREHHRTLLPVLQAYADAVAARHAEVHGAS